MRHIISVLGVIGISAALMASPVRAWEPDQLPPSYTLGLNAGTAHMGFADGAGGVLGNRATGSTLGVDTIPTFDSYFYDPGFNTNGIHQYTWQYRMVGRAPFKGGEDDNDRHGGQLQSVEKARQYQTLIPNSRLVVLRSDGYHIAASNADECVTNVLAFIKEARKRG
jgi:hypothetical protein